MKQVADGSLVVMVKYTAHLWRSESYPFTLDWTHVAATWIEGGKPRIIPLTIIFEVVQINSLTMQTLIASDSVTVLQ